MSKILKLKRLQTAWKAAETQAITRNNVKDLNYYSGGLFCIDAALDIFKEPSNTALKIDACCELQQLSFNHNKTKYVCLYCGEKGTT